MSERLMLSAATVIPESTAKTNRQIAMAMPRSFSIEFRMVVTSLSCAGIVAVADEDVRPQARASLIGRPRIRGLRRLDLDRDAKYRRLLRRGERTAGAAAHDLGPVRLVILEREAGGGNVGREVRGRTVDGALERRRSGVVLVDDVLRRGIERAVLVEVG